MRNVVHKRNLLDDLFVFAQHRKNVLRHAIGTFQGKTSPIALRRVSYGLQTVVAVSQVNEEQSCV